MLSTREVADRLKVNEDTVRRWCRDGKLPAVQVGRAYRIDPADLEHLGEPVQRETAWNGVVARVGVELHHAAQPMSEVISRMLAAIELSDAALEKIKATERDLTPDETLYGRAVTYFDAVQRLGEPDRTNVWLFLAYFGAIGLPEHLVSAAVRAWHEGTSVTEALEVADGKRQEADQQLQDEIDTGGATVAEMEVRLAALEAKLEAP